MSENRRPMIRKVENLDDLFLLNTSAQSKVHNELPVDRLQKTLEIKRLVPFENHPFRLYQGERLSEMVESIRDIGVILPVIVRAKDNEKFEILSGHNRVKASELAGLKEVPVMIMENLSDEDAILIVTETNLFQRSFSDLLHSERARVLAEHHKALSKQGRRTDLINEIEKLVNADGIRVDEILAPTAKKYSTHENIGQKFNLSKDTIARYLRINKLIKKFKVMLDAEDISIRAAYDLSFLSEDVQEAVVRISDEQGFKIDMKVAEGLRNCFDSKKLDEEIVFQILSGEKVQKSRAKNPQPYKLKNRVYSKYFSPKRKAIEVEEVIDKALMEYFVNHPDEREAVIG